MSITRNDRVLIVVNQVDSGDTDYLYRTIESVARATVDATLGDDYRRVVKLYDRDATLDDFVEALEREGNRAAVKRIDVILNLHGQPGKIKFYDRAETSIHVRDRIQALNLKP